MSGLQWAASPELSAFPALSELLFARVSQAEVAAASDQAAALREQLCRSWLEARTAYFAGCPSLVFAQRCWDRKRSALRWSSVARLGSQLEQELADAACSLTLEASPARSFTPPPPRPPPQWSLADASSLPHLSEVDVCALLSAVLKEPPKVFCGRLSSSQHVRLDATPPLDFGVIRIAAASPFAALQVDSAPRTLFRSAVVVNAGDAPVVLRAVRLEPPCRCVSILDDAELGCSAACARGVLLPPGGVYPLTMRLAVAVPLGVWSAWLLCVCHPPGVCAPERCVVAAALASATVLSASTDDAVRSMALSVDAPPFVPRSLRARFDAPAPRLLVAAPLPESSPPCGAWVKNVAPVLRCHGVSPAAAVLLGLHRLLSIEEAAQGASLRLYDQHRVTLPPHARARGVVSCPVPGLAEARPPLARGDWVALRPSAREDVEIAACVVSVESRESSVSLALPAGVDALSLGPVSVRFRLDRSVFARQRAALQAVADAAGISAGAAGAHPLPQLIPEQPAPPFAPITEVELADGAAWGLRLNAEQRDAVLCVLRGHADGAPFVVYGPPGTGKSTTLVGLTLQLFTARKRVLLCAPAPFAADLLCSRLAAAGATGLARLNDPRRAASSVKSDVAPFCVTTAAAALAPDVRIVIASCASSALLRECGLNPSFDAILVDEAGQATVPESLICLAPPLARHNTAIVLCGDPRQLGPVVHSRDAAAAGLSVSLLERFSGAAPSSSATLVYGCARVRGVTLRRNYRCHADILSLPSALFYSELLLPCADEAVTALPAAWADARGCGRIHFHGVRGEQRREGESPSWYNAFEAAAVVEAIQSLLACGLEVGHIGVLCSFRRQVQKVRGLLRELRLGAVRVGTCDDYQGQEEKVIIISTVVTRAQASDSSAADASSAFLGNPRRFNVAVSRAQALNLVIGHPVPLSAWPHWRALMKHALARGAYTGAGAGGDGDARSPDSLASAVARLAEASLLGSGWASPGDEEGAPSFFEGDERGWRIAM